MWPTPFVFTDRYSMPMRDADEAQGGWCIYIFAATLALLVVVGARTVWSYLSYLLMIVPVMDRTPTRSVGTQTDMAPAASRAAPAAPAGDTTATRPATPATFRLEYLTVPQLQTIAGLKRLPVTGLKCELIDRLIRASHA